MRFRSPWVLCWILAAAPGCSNRDTSEAPDIDTIRDEPRRFDGRTVSLAGRVATVWHPRVFALEGEGGEQIPILTNTPMSLPAGAEITVRGVVYSGMRAGLLPVLDELAPGVRVDVKGGPVVVADAIAPVLE